MKKIMISIVALLICNFVQAQVTIGTLDVPHEGALLDLKENNKVSRTEPNATKGLLFPKVSLSSSTSLEPLFSTTAEPHKTSSMGMVVYNVNDKAAGIKIGLCVWNGDEWVATGESGPWMKAETTDFATENTDSIYQMGPVAIGHSGAVDPSAILNVEATNQGVLFPRVTLSSTTDVTTIKNPTKGLLVFNTGDGALDYTGYVFWNGTEWVSLTSGSLAPGTIGAITCNNISLTPAIYEAGVPYDGTMTVPYTGSNGGVYPAITIGPVNGLTATLPAGNFTAGDGTLAFHITGTPTVTTPDVTTFPLTIGGKTCNAMIGAGDGIAPGDLVYYHTPPMPAHVGSGGENGNVAANWMNYYVNDLPVIGGKLRLDGYFDAAVAGPDRVSFNPRLVNITDSPVKIWFAAMTTVDAYNGANLVLRPNSWVNLDNGIYSTWGANSSMSTPTANNVAASAPNGGGITGYGSSNIANRTHGEVLQLDLSLDDKWYRIYYFMIVDNQDRANANASQCVRRCYMSIQRLY